MRGLLRRCSPRPQQAGARPLGCSFPNPVGLAAGYDKDGLGWRGLACLGFGHIEVGTVTPRPQPGNPRPRLFRLVEGPGGDQPHGLSRAGAPTLSPGSCASSRPEGLVLGVNLGKNKDTPLEEAAGDYLALLRTFAPLADYLAVNVSSPNTPGLRRLQARQALEELLHAVALERQSRRPPAAAAGQAGPGPGRCRAGRRPGCDPEHGDGRGDRHQYHRQPAGRCPPGWRAKPAG